MRLRDSRVLASYGLALCLHRLQITTTIFNLAASNATRNSSVFIVIASVDRYTQQAVNRTLDATRRANETPNYNIMHSPTVRLYLGCVRHFPGSPTNLSCV